MEIERIYLQREKFHFLMFRHRLLKCAKTLARSTSVSPQASQFEIPKITRTVKDTDKKRKVSGFIESGTPRLR